jgi:outer membrane receptor protein involved in Fe transport
MRVRAALATLAFCRAALAPAAADRMVEVDEVVVSAPSPDETVRGMAHGVSVITASDIARSTATSVADLLAREANLNLQAFDSSGRAGTIDIRGMGATAASNVLVLVDGTRLNENDLSGADLSTIPLSQVERIEIVRGGGAVRYGDGAVAGVINVITRPAAPGPARGSVQARAGSYRTGELRGDLAVSGGPLAARINLSAFETDGYRENADVSARDASLGLRYLPAGTLSFLELYARAAWHRDTSGLPGPVSAQAFASGSAARRASSTPFDESSTEDRRYTLGAVADFQARGRFEFRADYLDRDNPFVIGFNPTLSLADQRSLITSQRRDLSARYDLAFEAFGRPHTLSAGFDLLDADYARYQNGQNVLDSSRRLLGDVQSRAVYAAARFRLSPALTLNAGVRGDRFSSRQTQQRFARGGCQTVLVTMLVDVDPGPGVVLVPVQVPQQVGCTDAYRTQWQASGTWRNRGVEVGLGWELSPQLTAFAGYTQHFRNPNVDELALATTTLKPQTGDTVEAGARYALGDRLELGATAFVMRVRDEIMFAIDPATGLGLNLNLDSPTRRTGFELEARLRARKTVALRTSVGYVDARIVNTGTMVPLVPRTTATAEVEWAARPALRFGFSARYVGERFDGNDFENTRFPILPAYTVCDLVMRAEHRGLQLMAGINNLFGAVYSTVGYSGTYYPMPERNFYLSLRAAF